MLVPSVREICGADDVEISSCVFGEVVPRPKKPLALSKINPDNPEFPKRTVVEALIPDFANRTEVVAVFTTPKLNSQVNGSI